MLHQRGAAPVVRIVTLDAVDFGRHHFPHQIGVLAETLLRAAPARVAGQVGIGSPEHQAFVRGIPGIETCLERHNLAYGAGHIPIPGFADAVGLGESGAVLILLFGPADAFSASPKSRVIGCAAADDAVDGFGCAGVGDAQAGHALADDRGDLFIDGHQ